MKIICSRDRLIEAISTVHKAVQVRAAKPVLAGILIEAEEEIKLTGSDVDIVIECSMEADVLEAGSIVVPARTFADIVRKLPDDLVSLDTGSGQTLKIESGSTNFNIKYMLADEYPKIPVVEQDNIVKLPQQTLREMIQQTIFAVSADATRPTLNGSFFQTDEKVLEVVAIDGFRLAMRKVAFEDELTALKFIVPGKALQEVGRILAQSDQPVSIYPAHNNILFDTGRIKIVARLITGEYMNYRGIIPQTAETTVTIDPLALLAALERASLIIASDEQRYPVRMTIADDDTLVISANTDIGTSREEIAISMNGNTFDIDFNPRYFIDALRVIDEEEISIIFNGSVGPCVLRPLQGDAFAYLILPLRR
jgi:DNA polymerase-3 subunit beta